MTLLQLRDIIFEEEELYARVTVACMKKAFVILLDTEVYIDDPHLVAWAKDAVLADFDATLFHEVYRCCLTNNTFRNNGLDSTDVQIEAAVDSVLANGTLMALIGYTAV